MSNHKYTVGSWHPDADAAWRYLYDNGACVGTETMYNDYSIENEIQLYDEPEEYLIVHHGFLLDVLDMKYVHENPNAKDIHEENICLAFEDTVKEIYGEKVFGFITSVDPVNRDLFLAMNPDFGYPLYKKEES